MALTWWHKALALITEYSKEGEQLKITHNEKTYLITLLQWQQQTGLLIMSIDNVPYRWQLLCKQSCTCWRWYSFTHDTTITLARHAPPPQTATPSAQSFVECLYSPLGGRILKVLVKRGDFVKQGTPLVIIESMKMENEIRAPQNVFIKTISIHPNDVVEADQLLIVFAKKGAPHGTKSTSNE